jgi:hypothetical protein
MVEKVLAAGVQGTSVHGVLTRSVGRLASDGAFYQRFFLPVRSLWMLHADS